MSDALLGHEQPTAYVTGAALITMSTSFICINALAIRNITSKKEKMRLSAFGFMVVQAAANIMQLISHTIGGLFLLQQTDWSYNFVKVVAGNLDAAFDVYCSFAVLLAFNRLAAVVFPVRYKSLFDHNSLKYWYALAFLIWAVDLALFASPARTLLWDWPTCSWVYYEGLAMWTLNMCICLGGYTIATAIYALIFAILVIRRKLHAGKMTSSEKSVLLQASIVAVFELSYTLAWFLPFLPKGNFAQLVFNFLWLSNCVVSPVAYFVIQKRSSVSGGVAAVMMAGTPPFHANNNTVRFFHHVPPASQSR